MSKIFLVQTFPDERRLMTEFLEQAKYPVKGFYTDAYALNKFRQAIKNPSEPIVVISSQRDMRNCDDIGNKVHDELLRLPVPTLTIIYARAVDDESFAKFVDQIQSVDGHEVAKVKKTSRAQSPMDIQTVTERLEVRRHIDSFLNRLSLPHQ